MYRTGYLSLTFEGTLMARSQLDRRLVPQDGEDTNTHTAAVFRTAAGRYVAAYARAPDWGREVHHAVIFDCCLDAATWLLENAPSKISADIIAQLGLDAAETID